MSFARQVYLAAVLAGWAALGGWAVSEFVVLRMSLGAWEAVPTFGLLGAAIGAAVGAAAGLAGGNWRRTGGRAAIGLAGGLIGGLIGGLLGQGLYRAGIPQWLGWAVIGGLIGVTDGLFSGDVRRVRNGLIGGLAGGLAGGLLFRGLSAAVGGTGMTGRAVGFVSIGVAIGAMVGLVQVLLRRAWVTVIDGPGVGRQLVLSGPATSLGAGAAAGLVISGRGIEEEHAALVRKGAEYAVRDFNSLTGTTVNGRSVLGDVALSDGDVIQIGSTFLRYNSVVRDDAATSPRPAPEPPIQIVEGVLLAKPAPKPAPPVAAPKPPPPKPAPVAAPKPPPPMATPAVAPPKPVAGAFCPECGAAVSGPAGRRVCRECGAMS